LPFTLNVLTLLELQSCCRKQLNIQHGTQFSKKSTAGSCGRKVALWMHRYLREDACILDAYAHAVDLIEHKDKTASYTNNPAGIYF
jgi:hypothetical protein